MDMKLLLAPQCRTRWECTWTRWLGIRGSRSTQEIQLEQGGRCTTYMELRRHWGNQEKEAEKRGDREWRDYRRSHLEKSLDRLAGICVKALGIICKAPPLWNLMGAQIPVCTLSSLPKTCQWSGYAEKIGHYQTHLSETDESLVVSRDILPVGCFIHGKS